MADPKPRAIIDPAALSAPVQALAVDGVLVALEEGDTWAGAWAYPPAWAADQQEQWAAIQGNLIAERKRLDAVSSALAADLGSPASMIAAAIAEVDEAQEAREAQERLALGVKAWRKAQEAKYPTGVRHLTTVEGDVIIMVGMSLQECDAANARGRNLAHEILRADPNAHARAIIEETNAHRDAMRAKIDPAAARALRHAGQHARRPLGRRRRHARRDGQGKGRRRGKRLRALIEGAGAEPAADGAAPVTGGPAALLASLLPRRLRYLDEARAACLWLADVGQALLTIARAGRPPAQG